MNDFYTVHGFEKTIDSLSCRISFNESHQIFLGHFPHQPIVPGVCMMQMIKEFLEKALNKKLLMSHITQVKFLQLITPDVQPLLTITWKENEMDYQVNANLKKETDLFKLSGTFKPSK